MTQPPAATRPIPDLLSPRASIRLDLVELRQDLVFAFATRGEQDTFERVLGDTKLPASRWDRACFGRDLFLEELVQRALPVRIDGRTYAPNLTYLLRVITSPPEDLEVVGFRRAIFEELVEREPLRRELEQTYLAITKLRQMLCAGRLATARGRRLEILRAAHGAFTTLANAFEGASSGLARLRAFGEAVRASPVFERLDALLDHEQHLGTLDVRVRVGADGELRSFHIVAIRENRDNPFYTSPIARFFSRLRLFFRGFRLNGDEVAEGLLDDVFTGLEEPLALLFQVHGDIEFYLAGLGLRDLARSKNLDVCLPELVPSGEGGMDIEGLFNPLLLRGRSSPVPCTLRTVAFGSVVIVTGPNSGGKTRLLQAIALTQLLGQAGMFVPARRARLPLVSGLFVSLIEEARADQPEGQLGMELLRIRRMFEEISMGALVLLDELCSGTNPSEGEEIARLVISLLPEVEAQTFITTHLLQLAEHLAAERPIAQMEFLQVELDAREQPTYGFVPGVARSSLAHKTAARLGVTRDELLALIATKRYTGTHRVDVPVPHEPR
ncbi:DNA mismatch repair protein [Chondromyces crocatus]|uniref:DNA mismatch repair protein n=2 Tax=Chondromyces crocatus TaxID=52 RepID=A0A0K1ERU6_CHOCO|nr:DNA mismatch repair protein [Chondromyces crocatus]